MCEELTLDLETTRITVEELEVDLEETKHQLEAAELKLAAGLILIILV